MRMVVLDDDGTSSGDSSSTLMDSLSKKDKGKVIGSFSKGDKSRVLLIGDYLDDVGEDEIESVFEATKRGRVGLDHGGTNLAKNPNAHGRSLDSGLACASRGVGLDGAGRSAFTGAGGQHVVGPGGQHVGPSSALGAISDATR